MEPEAGGRPAAATVRLQRSDTTVTVRCSDLIETSEAKASREAEAVRKRDAARVAARQDREEDRREGQPGVRIGLGLGLCCSWDQDLDDN